MRDIIFPDGTPKTNKQVATTHKPFIKACEGVGLVPSPRQAGLYRRHQGLASLVSSGQVIRHCSGTGAVWGPRIGV